MKENENEAEEPEDQQSDAEERLDELASDNKKAPVVISGNNVYVAWWTNSTGNDEIMFRASSDFGRSFGDKINLSNSSRSQSQDVQIEAEGRNVVVAWWERNETNNYPVLRLSADNGKTFGSLLKPEANGTIVRTQIGT